MHSLALSALNQANLLNRFPSHPMVLDDWEQREIFDAEFVVLRGCTPTRAKDIRLAYDAYWQTLDDSQLADITPEERTAFEAFHGSRTTHYACILPGQVVRECVNHMRAGQLDVTALLNIEQLIVDEFQDLNACDQEFVQRIHNSGATLWVAGDDDQSIYSFRHAAPTGLITFEETYPGASTHVLADCFRCTPAVLAAATSLVSQNPSRIEKNLESVYSDSNPPVPGEATLWVCGTGGDEARVIAESCRSLIHAGMRGEDILILISNRRAQLSLIEGALREAGVPYAAPRGPALVETKMGRTLLALLRVALDANDYIAHRTLLGMCDGVGDVTCYRIAEGSSAALLNYRDLFYGAAIPSGLFNSLAQRAISRVSKVCSTARQWQRVDTIGERSDEIRDQLALVLNADSQPGQEALGEWEELRATLPVLATLEELLGYLRADSELGQLIALRDIKQRVGAPEVGDLAVDDRVRVMTMHGSKGLSGHVVFIPGVEQELLPGVAGVRSAGALAERRRLLYVSVTRARVRCILSRARRRTGAQAFVMNRGPSYSPSPSQFITELGLVGTGRDGGLSDEEIAAIVSERGAL